jgi:dolichol-phosphate mannosyltransferase
MIMPSAYRDLVALPVYNEVQHVAAVLGEVVRFAPNVLVVDDGSTDGTREVLEHRNDVMRVCHPRNLGYGAALASAFDYAIENAYDFLVTIDCDGQHEPQRIPEILAACRDVDIASGSRYLSTDGQTGVAPIERRRINHTITQEINCCLGLNLTDTFCGFKAYRVAALAKLSITEPGYAMPLELWVQAAYHRLRIIEVPIPLIYLEEKRSFGGALDDGQTRLNYYHEVLDRAIAAVRTAQAGQTRDDGFTDSGGARFDALERGACRDLEQGPARPAKYEGPFACSAARKSC